MKSREQARSHRGIHKFLMGTNCVGASLPATFRTVLVGASLLATVGCTVPSSHQPSSNAPAAASIAPPPAVTTTPWASLRDGDSRIELRLDRAGPLARLGHRHVIVTTAIHGIASFDPANPARASFRAAFRVDSLQVDDPAERAAAGEGFTTVLDAAAIAGTREHMLSSALLDAEHFPTVEMRLQQLQPVAALAAGFLANVVFTVRGEEYALTAPVQLAPLPEGGYAASGTWSVTHADLGLTPYSAAGGLIKVGDPIEIRFRLVAKPM